MTRGLVAGTVFLSGMGSGAVAERGDVETSGPLTSTPIKHLVIFQENVSFDHYFGTYPQAQNPPGEPRFVAAGSV